MDDNLKLPEGWGEEPDFEESPWAQSDMPQNDMIGSDTAPTIWKEIEVQKKQASVSSNEKGDTSKRQKGAENKRPPKKEQENTSFVSSKKIEITGEEGTDESAEKSAPKDPSLYILLIVVALFIIIGCATLIMSLKRQQDDRVSMTFSSSMKDDASDNVMLDETKDRMDNGVISDAVLDDATGSGFSSVLNWENAYLEILKSYYTDAYSKPMYDLIDINADDIPELIISVDDTYAGGYCVLYTFYEGQAVDLNYSGSGDSGEILISPGYNLVVDYGGIQGVYHINVFQLSGSSLEQIDSYSCEDAFGDPRCIHNGKSITPEEYNSGMEKYQKYFYVRAGRQFSISDTSVLSQKQDSKNRSYEQVEFVLLDIPDTPDNLSYIGLGTPNSDDGFLNLRSSPELTDNIVTEIRNGEKISLYDCGISDWLYAEYNSYAGYVKRSYVILDSEKQSASNQSGWAGAYAEILESYRNSSYYRNGSMYDLYDIDSNGTPELIISRETTAGNGCAIYSYNGRGIASVNSYENAFQTFEELNSGTGNYGLIDVIPDLSVICVLNKAEEFRGGYSDMFYWFNGSSLELSESYWHDAGSYESNRIGITSSEYENRIGYYKQHTIISGIGRKYDVWDADNLNAKWR